MIIQSNERRPVMRLVFALAIVLAFFSAPVDVALAEQPIKIVKLKKEKVKFRNRAGEVLQALPVDASLKSLLVGHAVKLDKKSGYYELRTDGQIFYLANSDVKTDHGVGVSGAKLCAKVKDGTFKSGSSGSGAFCK
ncbi:MAG: hypothetical protein AAF360_15655 [Pseudomonadota bacterium]